MDTLFDRLYHKGLRKAHFWLFFLFSGIISANASPDTRICIHPFTTTQKDKSFKDLHILLEKRLQYELLPREIKPLLHREETDSNCHIMAEGDIHPGNSGSILTFRITGKREMGNESKTILLENKTPEEVVDILALKIRHYLEQSITGKLRLSSTPLDCIIYLDGAKIGRTPAELILEKGEHTLRIEGEHLAPFSQKLMIEPGNNVSVSADMKFRGYKVKPWILATTGSAIAAIAAGVFEYRLHKEYLSVRSNEQPEFDIPYNRYRTAHYIRISLMNVTALTATVSIYLGTKNHFLKLRIFGNK